jgi:hypothetical protein
MPGPTQPWDQSEDPRESTVDLPRVDLTEVTDYLSAPAQAAESGQAAPYTAAAAQIPAASQIPAARLVPDSPSPDSAGHAAPPFPPPGVTEVPGGEPDPSRADGTANAPAQPAAAAQRPAARVTADRQLGGSVTTGRPPTGSLADLRSRLASLPDGHPSSPYEDGGAVRPLPIQLRQLELGLPAIGRGQAGGVPSGAGPHRAGAGRAGRGEPHLAGPGRAEPGSPMAEPAARDARSAGSDAGSAASDAAPAAPDGWPGAATELPTRNGAGQATPGRSGSGSSRNGNGHHARREAGMGRPGDLTLEPWPGQSPAEGRGNGAAQNRQDRQHDTGNLERGQPHGRESETRSHQAWPPDSSKPDARQPEARTPATGPRDTGPQDTRPQDTRSQDTRSQDTRPQDTRPADTGHRDNDPHETGHRDNDPHETGQLAAGHRELVERTLAACRAAEGQNVFGSYGSSGLTPVIQRIAAQLPVGGLAPGSEATSLKSADRFAAKLARLIDRNPGRPAEELASAISDAVRYAFAFDAADYTEGTWLVHRKLKGHGFDLEVRRNRWESPEYKGIFTRWRDPAHGLAFEVQFHTTASWGVAQRTHEAYVRITDPATSPAERARLRARQVAAAAAAKPPACCTEIADFRQRPR